MFTKFGCALNDGTSHVGLYKFMTERLEVRAPDGRGLRYNNDGSFSEFAD